MHEHSPRDVEDAGGNFLRTVCNECGATIEDEFLGHGDPVEEEAELPLHQDEDPDDESDEDPDDESDEDTEDDESEE